MPRYRSQSRSPSSSFSSDSYARSPSRSHHRSLSMDSPSHHHHRHRGSTSSSHTHSTKDKLKTSLVILGAIGAASLAASKLWPKGILYGEKESWAHEAKEEVKHALHRGGSDDSERRRRTRSTGHADHDTRRRRSQRVEIRDEVVAIKPDGRQRYVDTGWVRSPDGSRDYHSRRPIVESRDDGKHDVDNDSYEQQESGGSSNTTST
ncbi:uncharacterized protein GGS25DRAFT_474891 [Hypoxylon fragiforme]|uniref:uncharacterized protein n=1 Tax=Hypoxylon fragiforme TaxID=63214 RepID=UPI0020C5F891|nr:uncharacterized protein GGS25DRAFT_474891 [Hypoxylon fragiforme]KAI2612329.1 hypothetical protein GGS25DRAFT_474891 [Hypoxylon fragiforme]